MAKLVASLKPGGWLVVEEMDFASAALDPRCGGAAVALFAVAIAAHNRVMARHGCDPFYGRCLLRELHARGLAAVATEGRSACCQGKSAPAVACRLAFAQLREELIMTGELTGAEVDAILALLDDPATTFLTQTTVAAWGQRPSE